MACSCTGDTIGDHLVDARSVHVARPRSFDIFPDHSFEVTRTIKGAPRSNLRIDLHTGLGASCGAPVRNEPYVLIEGPYGFWQIGLCTQDHVGEEAVRKAVTRFGEGTTVSSRLDPYWAAQFAIPVPLALLGWGLWRKRPRKVKT